jgi:hypothetical protein
VQLSTGDAERIFRKLDIKAKKGHHIAGWLIVDGKRVLPLHYSHGRKAMPGNVPHRFRKALHLSVPEFEELKRCPMSREKYIALLRERLPF